MPLLHLPNEILLAIGDFLSFSSLARLLRTCQHLHTLLTPPLYRSILRHDSGASAVRFACLNNAPTVANVFLSRYHTNPNITFADDSLYLNDLAHSPLHLCAHLGSQDVINQLLDHNADINIRNTAQATPLHAAAATNKISTTQLLLVRGADPMARDDLEQMPLHLAAKKGHAGVVALLLRCPGVGVDDACKDPQNEVDGGYTALHGAADFGHVEVARELLRCGAKVDAKIEQSEWTPLGCAAAEGYEEVVRLLLEAGAEVNVTPEVPLRLAVDGKWCDGVLRLLLERGADVDSAIHGLYHAETANRLVEFANSLLKTPAPPGTQFRGVVEGEHGEAVGLRESQTALVPMEGVAAS